MFFSVWTSRPGRFFRMKPWYPQYKRLSKPEDRVWTGEAELLSRTPQRPTRSKSLYRLRYQTVPRVKDKVGKLPSGCAVSYPQ